jgi:Pyruvate:ferredoxin oxidoreductase and related 2-oxoacid:ferredoxin oxidoreductases, beta subunit
MAIIYQKPKLLTDVPFSYCPGCTHGVAHRLIAEVLEEMGEEGNIIGIAPVGCSVFAYKFFNCDMLQVSHGRAPAAATGVKRTRPDRTVFVYQGDGDLASIGTAEIVHAAARGENFTVIFINNAIYGMTGGQMAPTTMLGQKSTTSPAGRSAAANGYPIRISEMLATLDGPSYIARVSLSDPANILKAKRALRKAFENQKAKRGFSLVEMLSSCPTNWGMTPLTALDYVKNEMTKTFPLGVYKDTGEAR